jgi:hypothetical protein
MAENKYIEPDTAKNMKAGWENAVKAEKELQAHPRPLKSDPPDKPLPDWPGYVAAQWNRVGFLNKLAAPDEAKIGAGEAAAGEWKPLEAKGDFVDLKKALPSAPDKCVAYARTFVYSPADQEVRIWIGYNDDAAVWLNGRQIHRGPYYACAKWDDLNRPYELAQSGKLVKGWNCLAFKVERGGGEWGFSAHIVDFNNKAVTGLKCETQLPASEKCARYVPPEVGKYYKWAEVKDDYQELTPRLTAADLAKITGITGIGIDEHRFHLTLPKGTEPVKGSRYTAETVNKELDKDIQLDNYLNWDSQASAALRYVKDGKPRDLLLVRPEFHNEFLTFLGEPAETKPAQPASERVLGFLYIPVTDYPTTGERSARVVLVVDTALGNYPADELDLLAVP